MERTVTLSYVMKLFHITRNNEIKISENEVKHRLIILCNVYVSSAVPDLKKTSTKQGFETKITFQVNPCVISCVISNTQSRQTSYHIRYMYEFYLQCVELYDREVS